MHVVNNLPGRTCPVNWRTTNQSVTVVSHPLVQHKLTIMRDKNTSTAKFRALLKEISMLLGYEATRDLPLGTEQIETPLETMDAPILKGKKLVLVTILRAGGGILDGLLELVPSARVGHIGIYREPVTCRAVEYYCKLPADLDQRDVFVVDPMLATGHSAVAAITKVKAAGARSIRFICLVAAPEGIAHLHEHHADVAIYTASLDRQLNDHGYILPGLGDCGDRLFGTR
jgi:uracil phosphoribosyltransferase